MQHDREVEKMNWRIRNILKMKKNKTLKLKMVIFEGRKEKREMWGLDKAGGQFHNIRPKNKFKKTDIITSIFFDHTGMKLEINKRRKIGNFRNI